MASLVSKLVRMIKKEVAIWSITQRDMERINKRIMSLPLEGVSPREVVYNKHLQNMLWTFWFGKPLHRGDSQ